MHIHKFLAPVLALFVISGCAGFGPSDESRARVYSNNAKLTAHVEHIVVEKSKRTLKLIGKGKVLKEYRITLGFTPKGHKVFQGDGRTPEGTYSISAKKPNSQFYKSLKISYPNRSDGMRARQMGKDPGGEIYIHGGPRNNPDDKSRDWTAGCIAVTDREIEEIYSYVGLGTRITIRP